MKRTITVKFRLGDPVILKTEPEISRIVTGYIIRGKQVSYGLMEGTSESWHQDFEIDNKQKTIVKGFKK